ncbi:RNA polymerase, sigma-24 subunit, ECF subfamily [Candidatus Sulfopaludibacter sp. SbA4]|nr:RNA polymerase, sigma-24 subunit, ECF subfamily [Candidatus Sulfopaludibacter sp. SbA4]
MPESQPITRLLIEWGAGSEAALEQLTPLVYDELRKLARSYLSRERPGHTLQPTALVHEAYLRLVDQDQQTWESRTHFFGVAAHLMRLILVDWARKARAGKRGGGARHVPLEEITPEITQRPEELIALDDALNELGAMDARKVRIIEQRYFSGMTVPEVARNLGISTATVERDTRFAQLWLCRQMKGGAQA